MKILKAPGKVNLGLKITGRDDQYHLLDMIMAPVSLFDLIRIEKTDRDHDEINSTLELPETNTLSKTMEALRKEGLKNHYRVEVESRIPVQAGLGAASSQAAFLLKALIEEEKLQIEDQKLNEIAFSIGADVPFFLKARTSRVTSKGEIVIPFKMEPFKALLVKPDFGISTGVCFQKADEKETDPESETKMDEVETLLKQKDYLKAAGKMENDLYAPACKIRPELERIAESIRENGAASVFMSGSGSTLVACFKNEEALYKAKERLQDIYPDFFIEEVEIG